MLMPFLPAGQSDVYSITDGESSVYFSTSSPTSETDVQRLFSSTQIDLIEGSILNSLQLGPVVSDVSEFHIKSMGIRAGVTNRISGGEIR